MKKLILLVTTVLMILCFSSCEKIKSDLVIRGSKENILNYLRKEDGAKFCPSTVAIDSIRLISSHKEKTEIERRNDTLVTFRRRIENSPSLKLKTISTPQLSMVKQQLLASEKSIIGSDTIRDTLRLSVFRFWHEYWHRYECWTIDSVSKYVLPITITRIEKECHEVAVYWTAANYFNAPIAYKSDIYLLKDNTVLKDYNWKYCSNVECDWEHAIPITEEDYKEK